MPQAETQPVRVLIVDDSALVRRILTEMLGSDPGIEVLGVAADAFAARNKIKALNPDVITLDVEMPGMNGLQFLRNLMRLRPLPVVMVSSLTERGADVTLQALALGAVDYVCKPRLDLAHTLADHAEEIISKVKVAATARVRQLKVEDQAPPPEKSIAPPGNAALSQELIAIGASTGGTEAVREVLNGLSDDGPATVLVQHISKAFSRQFVQRVNQMVSMQVVEAEEGMALRRGCAYVAPGDRHLVVHRHDGGFVCRLLDDPPMNFHRPSVDILFRSVAQAAGNRSVGVILTGMGADGAVGLAEMRRAGARTIAQDQRTSVVWGMPSAAIKRNAVVAVAPLEEIAAKVKAFVSAIEDGEIAA